MFLDGEKNSPPVGVCKGTVTVVVETVVVDVVVDAVPLVAVVEVLPVGEFAEGDELQAANSSAAAAQPPTATRMRARLVDQCAHPCMEMRPQEI